MDPDDEELWNYEEPDWEPDPHPDICMNCGCPGRLVKDGEYECPNCGDIWDIYEPPPDVP
jgi:transposase